MIEGFVAAAAAPEIEGETIDLGSGSLTRMSDLVGRLVKISGSRIEPDFGALPDRPNENAIAADLLLAEELLGWRPATPLETGLKHTVAWYRARAKTSSAAERCLAAL